nr:uncharacterized protein LOC129445851 isoform X2 [Misgurnus anguillicaudatus]
MCRKHKSCSPDGIDNMYRETRPQPPDVIASTDDSENTHEAMPTASAASDMPENDSQAYLRNMSLFYLKLQGQLLIPASTIQTIVEEMQNVHELGQAYTIAKVSSFLKNDMSLSDEAVSKICDCIKESDLFSACHQGQLRTTYSRNQTFTKMFKYTEPQKVPLGTDDNMTQKCAYYIPVAETLKSFLQSRLGRNTQSQQFGDPDVEVFTDLYDGQNFKCHKFFNENPKSLKLILYQDSFEIVNPLGSAKKKHKVLAVYLSLANLPIHLRSNTDNMFLVLLCVEDDLKRFGVAKVFSELLADLKSLETEGINVDGETVKGGLFCIAGDNLGSHCIGGFTENFSRSQYFCRYCEITRSEFVADPNVCGPPRTPETYDAAVADLQAENIQDVRGIKCNMTDSERTFLDVAIMDALPQLQAVNKNILEEHLQSIGVETYDDLRFVTEADLMTALRPVEARKLLSVWKRKYHTPENSSLSSLEASSTQSLPSLSVSPKVHRQAPPAAQDLTHSGMKTLKFHGVNFLRK